MGQTYSKEDYSSIEEEQWYLKYLNGKPKASLIINKGQGELQMKQL